MKTNTNGFFARGFYLLIIGIFCGVYGVTNAAVITSQPIDNQDLDTYSTVRAECIYATSTRAVSSVSFLGRRYGDLNVPWYASTTIYVLRSQTFDTLWSATTSPSSFSTSNAWYSFPVSPSVVIYKGQFYCQALYSVGGNFYRHFIVRNYSASSYSFGTMATYNATTTVWSTQGQHNYDLTFSQSGEIIDDTIPTILLSGTSSSSMVELSTTTITTIQNGQFLTSFWIFLVLCVLIFSGVYHQFTRRKWYHYD